MKAETSYESGKPPSGRRDTFWPERHLLAGVHVAGVHVAGVQVWPVYRCGRVTYGRVTYGQGVASLPTMVGIPLPTIYHSCTSLGIPCSHLGVRTVGAVLGVVQGGGKRPWAQGREISLGRDLSFT